ncbi:hypothetical protein HDV00_001859 [Rhizophlyctis rosea]|nr:hypothetical protein HDV00_001859 [Rhizophlyctis rosea]
MPGVPVTIEPEQSSSPLLLGFEHLQLNVHSEPANLSETIAKVRHWYVDILGLKEIDPSPTILPPKPTHPSHLAILWFIFPTEPSQHFHIVIKSDSAAHTHFDSDLERAGCSTRAHPGIRVRDEKSLRELREVAIREGCQGVKEIEEFQPAKNAPGRFRFDVRDPFGNQMEFLAWL